MRTIDADELKALYEDLDDDLRLSVRVAKANIDDMPTIEAELVVRCKDCKYKDTDKCPLAEICNWEWVTWSNADDYCSKGERNEYFG